MPLVNPSLEVLLLVIILSFIAAILSPRLKVSYTTVLIIIGLGLSLLRLAGGFSSVTLDSNLILGIVVPPLMFEAAMRTRFEVFRTVEKTVVGLAIFGVVISALVSAFVLNFALGLPLTMALLFGVIVSPTDPVTIVSVLKRVKAPERLTTLLESEAYLNNATPVILFPIALSLSIAPTQSVSQFLIILLGGVGVGLLVSGIAEVLHRLVTEPLAETSFTIAVMYGSYILSESLGVSGLIAVPIAGLYMGNRTMRTAMSEETRATMTKFWEVVTFLATSFVFLLIGLRTDFTSILGFVPFIIVAFGAIVLARVCSVYPILWLTDLLGEKIPNEWKRILAFAGLRGAVSIALVLSLPANESGTVLSAIVFGVALLSLVVQAEVLQAYLRRRAEALSEPTALVGSMR